MKDIIKRCLLVTIVVIPLVFILGVVSLSIYIDNFRNVTRQHRDSINQMRATEHGHLIQSVRMDLIGSLIIDIRVKSFAENEEVLMLTDEIKPIIEEIYPPSAIELRIRCDNSNTIYGATWSRPWRGSPPQPSESFEWYQHSGIRVDEPLPNKLFE